MWWWDHHGVSRRWLPRRIGMAEGAGPFVDATAEASIRPAKVLEAVIMSTGDCIVAGTRGATLGVGRGVIYVAVGGWHATSGK